MASGGGDLTVTLTAPAGVVTTAAPTASWTFAPGTQASYRFRIFSDAAALIPVYDTGFVPGSAQSIAVPAGSLFTNRTYYARVFITTTTGESGSSSLESFTTSFATSGDVMGVTMVAIGGCDQDSAQLPGLRLRWLQVVPGGGETFLRYIIQRKRPDTETDWTTVHTIDAIGTLTWTDWSPASRTVYQYAVLWEASSTGTTLISNPQSPPPTGMVAFDYAYIHAVSDPGVMMRYAQFEATVQQRIAPTKYELPWGRSAPVGYVGAGNYRTIALPLLPHPHERPRWRRELDALIARQVSDGEVFCVRLGVARERLFAQFDQGANIRMGKGMWDGSVAMTEVSYDEATG